MLAASVLLGTLSRMGPAAQVRVLFSSCIDPVTVNLVAGLMLILVLENVIRTQGILKRMLEAVVNLSSDRRVAMAVLPAVIGLLPSAGGAVFSAPMVQEAAADASLPAERKAFVNYWFRHIWEYCSPLYPGIVLAAAVTKTPIDRLLLSQVPLPLAVVAIGALLAFRQMPVSVVQGKRDREEVTALIATLSPIALAIVLVAFCGLPLSLAMVVIVAGLFLFYRYPPAAIATTVRESLSGKIALMVVGVMTFKGMLDATGVIDALPRIFAASNVPTACVLFLLPFLVGLLTGLTVGFVGATFPILTAMLGTAPHLGAITFAFASGFAGVMLSPTHLCLVLTLQYFHADMGRTYRLLALPVSLVLLVGLLRFWF